MLSKNPVCRLRKNTKKFYKLFKAKGNLWFCGLVLAIAVAACAMTPEKVGQPIVSPSSSTSPNSPTAVAKAKSRGVQIALGPEIKATRRWKFVFATKKELRDDPFWVYAWEYIQKDAKDFGVDVTLLPNPCDSCVADQIKAIDSLTREPKPDGLIISPVDSVALSPVVEKLIATGTPVLAIDTPVNSNRILTFVEFDNFAGGKAIGEWVADKLQGQGQVAILNGSQAQQNAIDRYNGFLAGLQQRNIEIVATKSVKEWDPNIAKEITKEWLTRFPKLKAIVSADDEMALGASAVAKAAKFPLLITGFDAIKEALDEIKNGEMAATISQLMDRQTRLSLQLLIRHLEKKETFPPLVTISEVSVISKDNVNNYR